MPLYKMYHYSRMARKTCKKAYGGKRKNRSTRRMKGRGPTLHAAAKPFVRNANHQNEMMKGIKRQKNFANKLTGNTPENEMNQGMANQANFARSLTNNTHENEMNQGMANQAKFVRNLTN